MAAQEDVYDVVLHNEGFASLVSDLIHRQHGEEGPEHHIKNSQLGVGISVSKNLPSTGLKRNTKDRLEREAEGSGNNEDWRSKSGSQLYSSLLFTDAEGRDDSSTMSQQGRDQEEAGGRGSSQHEKFIPDSFDNHVTESPVEEHGGSPSSSIPKSLTSSVRVIRRDDSAKSSSEQQSVDQPMGRSPSIQKQIPDEAGRSPNQLPGMKSEDKPGPMNEIYLEPRITHIHVSYFLPLALC